MLMQILGLDLLPGFRHHGESQFDDCAANRAHVQHGACLNGEQPHDRQAERGARLRVDAKRQADAVVADCKDRAACAAPGLVRR